MAMTQENEDSATMSGQIEQYIREFDELNAPRLNFSVILTRPELLERYHIAHRQCRMLREHMAAALKILSSPAQDIGHSSQLKQLRDQFSALFPHAEGDPALAIISKKIDDTFEEYEACLREIDICLADIGRWGGYRFSNGVEFFVMRLRTYVKGGTLDEAGQDGERIQLKGLRSSRFGQGIVKGIQNSVPVKKFYTYPALVAFVRRMDDTIRAALNNPGWEGFYGKDGFYANLRKGKNYIRMMQETFGNAEIAEFLAKLDDKIHENPQMWIAQLDELQKKLGNYTYQNQAVIYPVMQELSMLLHTASEGTLMKGDLAKHLKAMFSRMEEQIRKQERGTENVIRSIRAMLAQIDDPVASKVKNAKDGLERLARETAGLSAWQMRVAQNSIVVRERMAPVIRQAVAASRSPGGGGAIGRALIGAMAIDSSMRQVVAAANDDYHGFKQELHALFAELESTIFPHLRRVMMIVRHYDRMFIIDKASPATLSGHKGLLPEVEKIIAGAEQQGRKIKMARAA